MYTHEGRVAFSDTDAAGVVHFTKILNYVEIAEHEMFRSHGHSVLMQINDSSQIGWPRMHVDCDYKLPLQFEDEFSIEIEIAELKEKLMSYQFKVLKNERISAQGTMTIACVIKKGGHIKAIEIPQEIRAFIDSI
ncbi:MAG: acyl-CoA thioesterase [Lentisphaeria bacterium]|nr:acyl-CoA thioesterase [Lentisphaeria bacterium]NQZ69540.1 acyl-CoA thioesterase [Lentisphaeria bacterium]